jgi:pimeloyl-ACP methyl ester carboxylesterase
MTTLAGLSYERAGDGQPMVLLHGAGHRRQMWQPIIDRLADIFDMIAVDLPGYGESAPLPTDQQPTTHRLADHL